tara:strand:+ start:297 stop:1490 length:1194 start_codon:yes stop_codon:yes gene_type:complete
MPYISPTLFIEINNFEYVFLVGDKNEDDCFSVIYSKKIPIAGIKNERIDDLNLVSKMIKENIYLIEKKVNYTFKEVVLIIDNFNCSLVNFTGFKNLNGSQLGKDNVTYILNDLKLKLLEIEKEKTVLHIFNTKYLLDKKKISNLPIGLFGNFYSHELSFYLIDRNDYKNLENIFEKCNLRLKRIISKKFILGTKIINDNTDLENFFNIQIDEDNMDISFYENHSFKFFQKFNFGTNLILNDISKVVALKKQTIKNIIHKLNFSENYNKTDFIEKEFFDNQNFRKIKKELIYDVASARIQEIAQITLLKNINIKSFLEKNLKVFLKIKDGSTQKCFENIYRNFFSNNKYELHFIKNYDANEVYENALNIVQYGWKKEALPIIYEKKSLITRFFDFFFK